MLTTLYGNYRNEKFTDVYTDADIFINEYQNSGIPTTISEESARTLYYLLYARYGNSTIASSDVNQFKYRLFSIIYQAGPAWEKKIEIQSELRDLTNADIRIGSKAIYNHAFNPSTAPTTATLTELEKIDEQNTATQIRGALQGYSDLIALLENDVTESFLRRFHKLFLYVVTPERPLWYVSEEE